MTTTVGGDPPVVEDVDTAAQVPDLVAFSPQHDDPDGDIDLTTIEVLTVSTRHRRAPPRRIDHLHPRPDLQRTPGSGHLPDLRPDRAQGDDGTARSCTYYGHNPPVV